MADDFSLAGKTALVTGAARGLAREAEIVGHESPSLAAD